MKKTEKLIYLNYAATSYQKPACVADAMVNALQKYGNAARGVNDTALEPLRMITELRSELADFFGFSYPARVVFVMNATQALNMTINGLLKPGDHVIATDLEHNSVLRPLYALQKNRDVAVSFVPADRRGNIRYEDFEYLIRPETKAIICTHASNLTGNILDIKRIANIAHKHHILFILDTAQTAGSMVIHMEEIGIDVLCFTGHKGLLGPQGTGGLLVSPSVDLVPQFRGGTGIKSFEHDQPEAYPEHLEAGTLNSPGLAGLLASLRYIRSIGLDKIEQHEHLLTERFYQGVLKIPGVIVYGDFERPHTAIVTINMNGLSSDELSDVLSSEYGIQIRSGSHCAPRMHEALGTAEKGAVRFSFGWYTSEQEIDLALQALQNISTEVSSWGESC